jgi:hypothetical protein
VTPLLAVAQPLKHANEALKCINDLVRAGKELVPNWADEELRDVVRDSH